jgi:hypothetical protein
MTHHNQTKELTIWFLSTTLSKVDKADTSSVEGPTVQALVARSGSKALNNNLADNDSNISKFHRGVIRDRLFDELLAADVMA